MNPSARDRAAEQAQNLYEVDKLQIVLNGGIAFLTSSVASVMAWAMEGISTETAMFVFIGTFLPAFTAKVITEYAKRRAVIKAQRDAYEDGRIDARFFEKDGKKFMEIRECFWARIFSICNVFTFYSSTPEVMIPYDSSVLKLVNEAAA